MLDFFQPLIQIRGSVECVIKSLSVKVSLNYVISSRVVQKKSKEYQPLTPNLFFQLISFYCVFDGSSKLTGETNQFKGFGHLLGLFFISYGSLLLSSYRVYQLSCNIKNRCIFASKADNQILKKVLKRFGKKFFSHAKRIDQTRQNFAHSQLKKKQLFLMM